MFTRDIIYRWELEQWSKRRGENSLLCILPALESKLGPWEILKGFVLAPSWQQAELEADKGELIGTEEQWS